MEKLGPVTSAALKDLPQIVYKYRDWENLFHRQVLAERIIYFAPSCELNDPFDVNVKLRFDRMSRGELCEYFKEPFQKANPHLTSDQANQEITTQFESDTPENYYKRFHDGWETYSGKTFGIFSAACTWDNLLMWSHYSNSHKGFCIGFDLQRLTIAAIRECGAAGSISPIRVNYTDERNIDPNKGIRVDNSIRMLTTKYCGWEYEDEIRFLLNKKDLSNEERRIKIPDEAIAEVYFGARMPLHHQDDIKHVLASNRSHPKLYIIENEPDKFGLQRHEVAY